MAHSRVREGGAKFITKGKIRYSVKNNNCHNVLLPPFQKSGLEKKYS